MVRMVFFFNTSSSSTSRYAYVNLLLKITDVIMYGSLAWVKTHAWHSIDFLHTTSKKTETVPDVFGDWTVNGRWCCCPGFGGPGQRHVIDLPPLGLGFHLSTFSYRYRFRFQFLVLTDVFGVFGGGTGRQVLQFPLARRVYSSRVISRCGSDRIITRVLTTLNASTFPHCLSPSFFLNGSYFFWPSLHVTHNPI